MNVWRPSVSVVIAVLDEEVHIRECLESVRSQTYPADLVEVFVADGGSSDRTRDILAELVREWPSLHLLDNPHRRQAAGLNIAIRASRGEVIARLDGHSAWSARHLERCVELLAETGADNVGGTMDAVGESVFSRAVAIATRSPFGVGGARYRYAQHQMDTDTVYLGCFRRAALDRVGLFDERLPQHEDYELNRRIRRSGGRIVFSPDIPTRYWVRSTPLLLLSQYLRYGRGKVRVARLDTGVMRPHHLVPPLAVAAFSLAAVCAFAGRCRPLVALSAAYTAGCMTEGIRASRGQPPAVRRLVPVVFPLLHGGWGGGFWWGVGELLIGRDRLARAAAASSRSRWSHAAVTAASGLRSRS